MSGRVINESSELFSSSSSFLMCGEPSLHTLHTPCFICHPSFSFRVFSLFHLALFPPIPLLSLLSTFSFFLRLHLLSLFCHLPPSHVTIPFFPFFDFSSIISMFSIFLSLFLCLSPSLPFSRYRTSPSLSPLPFTVSLPSFFHISFSVPLTTLPYLPFFPLPLSELTPLSLSHPLCFISVFLLHFFPPQICVTARVSGCVSVPLSLSLLVAGDRSVSGEVAASLIYMLI